MPWSWYKLISKYCVVKCGTLTKLTNHRSADGNSSKAAFCDGCVDDAAITPLLVETTANLVKIAATSTRYV